MLRRGVDIDPLLSHCQLDMVSQATYAAYVHDMQYEQEHQEFAHLNQDVVHGWIVCDFIVHALCQALGKMAENERLGIILLVEVINIRDIEVLFGNRHCTFVVGG